MRRLGTIALLGVACARPSDLVVTPQAPPAPAIAASATAPSREVRKELPVENAAPTFTLTALDGRTVSSASLRGAVVVIHFWATWCAPCKLSMPRLEELSKQHGAGGLVVLGIAEDDDAAPIPAFLNSVGGVSFGVGQDEHSTIAQKFHLQTMPTTIVLDRRGAIRHAHAGYHDGEDEELAREVNELLADR